MNEQQRIFLTVAICTSIWLGWQIAFPPPPKAPEAQAQLADQTPSQRANGPDSLPAVPTAADVGIEPQAAAGATPVADAPLAQEAWPFHTPLFVGSQQNNDASFAQLALPAFAARHLPKDHPASLGASLVAGTVGRQAALHAVVEGALVPLAFVAPGQAGNGDGRAHWRGLAPNGLQIDVMAEPEPEQYVWQYRVQLQHRGQVATKPSFSVDLALGPRTAVTDADKAGWSTWLPGGDSDTVSGIWLEGGELRRKKVSELTTVWTAAPSPAWAGIEQHYFLAAWLPEPGAVTQVQLGKQGDAVSMRTTYAIETMAPGAQQMLQFRLFLGPKRTAELSAAHLQLRQTVDYNLAGIPLGALARPMMFALRTFFGWTHSWGVAIVMLTFVVKLLLLPFTIKSMASIKRMQAIKPDIDQLKQRYANEPDKLSAAQLQLFRDKKINPASGCLPMLLQLPVWLTLYRSLGTAVDLYHQPFLWVSDLTAREPFPLLALATGVLTVVQQRSAGMAMDNQQARIMAWLMPAFLTAFMLNLPAGLVLYIFANSALTILQQVVITRRVAA